MGSALPLMSELFGLSKSKKIIAGSVMHAAMIDTRTTALRQPSASIPEPRINGNIAPPKLEDISNKPVAMPRLP